jgi:hypothetical protein
MRTPFFLGILLASSMLAVGCEPQSGHIPGQAYYPESGGPVPERDSERDSVLTVLRSLRQGAFARSFALLTDYDYTRYVRTEQFNADDFLVAYQERIVRHEGGPTGRQFVERDAESAGTFDFGYFSRFVSETVDDHDPANLAEHVLPADPPYLSERHRDAYRFRILPDTLMWDTVAQVVEVRARPGEGDGQNIRLVRLYIDRATRELIAVRLDRIDLALLFKEESQFYIHIRPLPDGNWLPYNTRLDTQVRVPFRKPQRFRTVSTFSEFATPTAS